ncbi:MAG: 23S rRNA (adenine(2503)-C(2))-methyltransferase RlmN [Phycisphaerales bacterium]
MPAATDNAVQLVSEAMPAPLSLRAEDFVAGAVAQGIRRDLALDAYHAFYRVGPQACVGTAWEHAVPRPVKVLTTESDEGPVHKFLLPVKGNAKPAKPSRIAGPETSANNPLPVLDSHGGLETESVVIPMATRSGSRTYTLCVSSQVGCAMNCGFCETAQMGLIRSLEVGEIVQQWYAAKHYLGEEIKNIVFMGMGEPLDNPEAVLGTIGVLTDHHGPALAMRHITISTVGRLDGLAMLRERVQDHGWKQLNLAVSVNAPNEVIRSQIMPINRAMPLAKLVQMLEEWPLKSSKAICAEYVLIPGVNDQDEHADELSALLKNVRCCVNVIPYNPRRDSPWPAPEEESVERFLRRLESNGQFCKRRRTKGRDTMAACGQLGNEKIRGRRYVGSASA